VESSGDEATETGRALTEDGVVLGTAAYMSPEQAEGRRLDGRSDIFSFGAMLYEMLTGQKPFQAESRVATLAKILHQDPLPLSELAPGAGSDLEKAVLRCLRKDPARRYQTMGDLRVALEDLEQELGAITGRSASPVRARFRRWSWVALPALAAAGFLGWRLLRTTNGSGPPVAVPIMTDPGTVATPSLSPDAEHVAFVWAGPRKDNTDLYVQMIGSGSPLRLTADPAPEHSPAWSPDGRSIAFLRGDLPGRSELLLIPPLGGPERKLADIHVRRSYVSGPWLSWSADSRFVIFTDSPAEQRPEALFAVSVETGEKTALTNPESAAAGDSMPAASPDGRWLIFRRAPPGGVGELYRLPLGEGLRPAGEPRRLTTAAFDARHPAWMPDSREILVSARSGLWKLDVFGGGQPRRVPFVGEDGSMPVISRRQPGKPTRLVYVRSFSDYNVWRVETPAPGQPASSPPAVSIASTRIDRTAQFSPDGRRVVFASNRSGDMEIWTSDPDGSRAAQLTSMGANMTSTPRWSPDGQTIAFDSNLEGQFEVYTVPLSGGKPRRLTSHPANDHVPSFSRDGRWIYFSSNRSGTFQIWKMPAAGGDAIQVTRNGGFVAFESADGKFVYYTQTPNAPSILWRLPVGGGDPEKVLEGVVMRAFSVIDKGVYYVNQPVGSEPRLTFFDFASGRTTAVAALGQPIHLGLSATADGKVILYSKMDSSVSDLMLVENFR
jgi:Tol biopolymer transport system component